MTRQSIQATIAELLAEDAELKVEEQRIQRRRSQISSAVVSLTALENDQMPEFAGGLAEAIRIVLQADPKAGFSPSDVRTGLKILKFNFDNLSNPLASIHSVLKRLHESGEVYVSSGEGHSPTRYQWVERETLGYYARFGNRERTTPAVFQALEILADPKSRGRIVRQRRSSKEG